jgi:hypothetical protein
MGRAKRYIPVSQRRRRVRPAGRKSQSLARSWNQEPSWRDSIRSERR